MMAPRTVRRLALSGLILALLGSCGLGGGTGGERLARALGLPETVVSLCGDPRILGHEIAPIGRQGACGISRPLEVFALGEVTLSRPARLKCETAVALKSWVEAGAQPAAQSIGTRITGLKVAADYACRRRNNRSSGPLSEHAKGNAIDISAVTFANGDTATVIRDWRSRRYGKTMQAMHAAACGPFGVVLGPRADRHHHDHFHFDISNLERRYCR